MWDFEHSSVGYVAKSAVSKVIVGMLRNICCGAGVYRFRDMLIMIGHEVT